MRRPRRPRPTWTRPADGLCSSPNPDSPRAPPAPAGGGDRPGTTNSLVATVRSGHAQTLADAQGATSFRGAVYPRRCGGGEVVRQAAAATHPITIASAKRLIGRAIGDVKSLGTELPYEFVSGDSAVPRIRTVAGEVTPIEVSAEILKGARAARTETLVVI